MASHARWRARVVAYGPLPASASLPASPSGDDTPAKPTPRHWSWARLMQRAFELDVLACPRWRTPRLIATVEDPRAIREVLDALVFSTEAVDRAPPPRPSVNVTPAAEVCA